MSGASQSHQIQQQIAQEQSQANQVREQAMVLSASRQQTENVRNMQRARSMALSAATNQGAQLGTGLQGGYGQISGSGNWNALGISQAEQSGQQMFDINGKISGLNSQLSDVQSGMATDQGIASLGGAISGLGKMGFTQGFGGKAPSLGSGGSSYIGNPAYSNTGGYY